MNLKSISISNFRSIKELSFNVFKIADGSFTYGLIGENEAGKTSFLKGVAFKDATNNISIKAKDKTDKTNLIETRFVYNLSETNKKIIIDFLKKLNLAEKFDEKNFQDLIVDFAYDTSSEAITTYINFFDKDGNDEFEQVNENDELYSIIESLVHKTIFWSYDEKFLISKEIDLASFFADPYNISVPLTNCFLLAGYQIVDFPKIFTAIKEESTEREEIREKLGEVVSKHIKRVWKNHDISVSFDLTEAKINFHIKDIKAGGKAKTADQRSDGFKHFVSFLLTISAQHKNAQLSDTILLLDEPETHLHPKAQEFFLNELIEISKTKNNIVFFATHSNYFIDKEHLERNYKVFKEKEYTEIKRFDNNISTYASVNHDVFGIPSIEYHNELYGDLIILTKIENIKDFDRELLKISKEFGIDIPIKKNYRHTNGNTFDCCFSTFIRHQISHTENKNNDKFKTAELEKCILIMQEIKQKFIKKMEKKDGVGI